jgi:hypothetical protein
MPSTHFLIACFVVLIFVPSVPAAAQASTRSSCYAFDRPYFTWINADHERPHTDSTHVLRLLSIRQSRLRVPVIRAQDVQPVPFEVDSATKFRWERFSYWMVNDSGLVEISWRNGLYGPVFHLEVSGDSLYGRAVPHGRFRSGTSS